MRRLSLFVAVALAVTVIPGPSSAAKRAGRRWHPPRSGVVSVRGPARSAATVTSAAGPAAFTTVPVTVGTNQNVIVGDVTNTFEHSSGPACHVGDQTPQNETTISMDPTDSDNLIGGANDYRYFVASEQRYDGSAPAYVSHDGGATWTNEFMPGLSENAGGTYQGVGDPAFAWAPDGSAVYYANIAFNRQANPATGHSAFASSVAVSRSTDKGDTWDTNFVIQSDNPNVFHDKEWVGVGPDGTVYVTWARFQFQPKGKTGLGNYQASPIVISESHDLGETWSAPKVISGPYAQFSTPVAFDDDTPDGVLYVSYEEWNNPVGRNGGRAMVARSTDGGDTWTQHFVGRVNDLPSPLPHGAFRAASYPVLDVAEDGILHIVWSNWQAGSADIVYTRSSNGGASWTRPVTISQEATKSDQFFQWVDASDDYVHVGFVDRQYTDNALLDHSYVVSTDGGDTWSQTERVTTTSSRSDASLFGANCTGEFIGDYTGIVADGATAHLLWMDGRPGTQPTSPSGDNDDQDAFHAEVTVG
jgi:Neuraminidase (sialidase)